MTDHHEHDPVSPIEATFSHVYAASSERQRSRQNSWSASTQTTHIDVEKPNWAPPPLPPIPQEKEHEAWRKRSLRRCSYASQMSNYNLNESLAAKTDPRQRDNVSTISFEPSIKSFPSRNFSRPTRRTGDQIRSRELNWQAATFNPMNWGRRKKWFHTLAAGNSTSVQRSLVVRLTKHCRYGRFRLYTGLVYHCSSASRVPTPIRHLSHRRCSSALFVPCWPDSRTNF